MLYNYVDHSFIFEKRLMFEIDLVYLPLCLSRCFGMNGSSIMLDTDSLYSVYIFKPSVFYQTILSYFQNMLREFPLKKLT